MPQVHTPDSKPVSSELSNSDAGVQQRANVPPVTLEPLLSVIDLRKSFTSPAGERLEVLRGVTFSANAGEAIAVTGASGAGKSTLLNLIGGIEETDQGSISFNGFAIERGSRSSLARYRNRNLGYVFQFHHLLPDLTAVENVCLPLLLARQNRQQALIAAHQALDRMGLSSRASAPVMELSGGEQQRIAVCRALITQPRLVLADEPTGNLDAKARAMVANDLLAYAVSHPAIVIIATHNEEVAQQCNRILVIEAGKARRH